MAEGQWYYCLKHRAVEPYEACRSDDRLGPYATRGEAEHALERARERNEIWDNDPRFNDRDPDEDPDDSGGAVPFVP